MNKEQIKEILDKANISVVDELNILEYIDELEQVKEKNDKAIEYINDASYFDGSSMCADDLLDILRGEDNED